jgi:hypothetical protein
MSGKHLIMSGSITILSGKHLIMSGKHLIIRKWYLMSYIQNVPEKEIYYSIICHRTALLRGKTWRTGWRASSLPTRTPRRPWRSATRGWRATRPPSARWGPWLSCWACSTWQAYIGEGTLDLAVLPSHWTGEKCLDLFLPVHLLEPGLCLQLIRYSAGY